jgi:hypothetical protein
LLLLPSCKNTLHEAGICLGEAAPRHRRIGLRQLSTIL